MGEGAWDELKNHGQVMTEGKLGGRSNIEPCQPHEPGASPEPALSPVESSLAARGRLFDVTS